MPTRAEVIASKIQQYDAQITGDQVSDIEGAIAKMAIAQLAGGISGGGGGGGTGDASAANQVTGNASLSSINTKLPPLGQAASAQSLPVVLPSDQVITANAGTNLNTSLLALEGGNLASINTKLPVQGQALITTSMPVVLPVTQVTLLTPPTNIGYSTSALQTPANASLVSIDAKLTTPTIQLAPPATTIAIDVANSVITTSAIAGNFSPPWGVSQSFQVGVSGVSGTGATLDVTVQEGPGGNTAWYDIYVFPSMTLIGSYNSPMIATAGRSYRYIQTITGTTPSFTRGLFRIQSNIQVPFDPITIKLGGASISASEFFVGARFIKKINVRNAGASLIFLQYYNSSTPLVTGAIPVSGEIYPIAASNGNILIDSTTLGGRGAGYGANTRVALSLTQQTYTPVTAFAGISVNIEVLP